MIHAEVIDGALTGIRKNFSAAPTGYPAGVEWLPIQTDADPPGDDATHKIVITPRIAGGVVHDEKARVLRSPDEIKEWARGRHRAAVPEIIDAIVTIAEWVEANPGNMTDDMQALINGLK